MKTLYIAKNSPSGFVGTLDDFDDSDYTGQEYLDKGELVEVETKDLIEYMDCHVFKISIDGNRIYEYDPEKQKFTYVGGFRTHNNEDYSDTTYSLIEKYYPSTIYSFKR